MEDRHLVVMAAAGAATLASCASATSNRTRHPDNFAFMFIKPHANKKAVVSLVKAKLAEASVRVASEGVISAAQIDDGGLIDAHYGTLAQRAMSVPVLELGVWSASKAADFEEKFGVAHTAAAAAGQLVNLKQAMERRPELSAVQLEAEWRAGECVKLAPGTYVAKLTDQSYCVNGFYGSMREKYTSQSINSSGIYWMCLEWNEQQLGWEEFRGAFLGPTDCTKAEPSSLRGAILSSWESLGLAACPSGSDNGVHASASALEARAERSIWLKIPQADDPLTKAWLKAGLKIGQLERWLGNPCEVVGGDGEKVNVFDVNEGKGSAALISLALKS